MIIIGTIFVFFASLTFGQSLSLDVDREESEAVPTAISAEWQGPFYLQLPFFRLTLTAEHGGGVFDVLPFVFPSGNKPQSLAAATGDVTVRFVSRPLAEYKVALHVLAKIDTFEELVVDDLEKRLRTTGQEIAAIPTTETMKTQQIGDQLDQLYGYFEYFRHSPPKLKMVADKIVELYPQFLLVEAAFLSRKNDWQSALVRFDRIHRLSPNFPKLQPRWSEVCSSQVSFLVSQHRHRAARQLLADFLQKYPDDTTALQWKQRFYEETEKVLQQLRTAIDQKQWKSAYEQWDIANELAPELPEVQQMKVRMTAECPRFIVGVGADWFRYPNDIEIPSPFPAAMFDTGLLRKQRLHGRTLFECRGDEVEGRRYISPYGAVLSETVASTNDKTVPSFILTLPANSPLTSYEMVDILSRNIVSLEPSGETFFRQFQCVTPQQLRLTATYPHPRPAAFLQNVFLPKVTPIPNLIVEKVFPVGETGLLVADSSADQLLAGKLDAVANVYPWDLARLRKQVANVQVEPYSAKRIHILVPNPHKTLPSDRQFRRALLYSLDREKMVSLLLCGETGADVISGPSVKPSQFRDPIGYGYDTTIAPLPYHPQLAVLLLLMVLQKDVSTTAIQTVTLTQTTLTPPTITLAVPSTEVAHVAAKMIQRCWQAIGVHTNVVSTTDTNCDAVGTGSTVDFWYVEYPISEPFVDVPRLLMSIPGPDTVTPHLALEMEKLSKSQTWAEIGAAMRGIHRLTASELTVLPLWQWTDYAAFRKDLRNVKQDDTQKLEHFYENVEHWNTTERP